MIIFLYGGDTYRMKEKLKEIVESYKRVHKSGLNLNYIDYSDKDSSDISFADFRDKTRQTSMFKEKKLFVIFSPFSKADFKEEFLNQKEDFIKSGEIIVFAEEKPDKRDLLFKFLKKNAKCQEFIPLTGQKLKNWILKEFEKYNIKIEAVALEKLIDYIGNDLWRLSNEIKKLSAYGVRLRPDPVRAGDVELLVRSKIETDIFKTIDAIAQNDKKRALNLLHNHLEKGDSPLYLLSMINYQFRNLLIIKDLIEKNSPYNIILKKSGLHPFVVRKSYSQCRQFSLQELKKIYRRIFEIDLDIKTGKIEPATALDLLIAEI